MKKTFFLSLVLALAAMVALNTSCGNKKDLTPPTISGQDFLPADCDIYYAGDTIIVHFLCSDDTELGNFNIDIHSNFDHHTHGSSAVDCDDDANEHHHDDGNEDDHHHEEVEGAWVFNQDYAIPTGKTEYETTLKIAVPHDAMEGDYHFMLRLTDRAGWQTLKAVAMHIEN